MNPKQLASPNVFKEFQDGEILINFGNLEIVNMRQSCEIKHLFEQILTNFRNSGSVWNLVFRQINFLNLWDSQETINPLKIPTPAPAPDRGGNMVIID